MMKNSPRNCWLMAAVQNTIKQIQENWGKVAKK